MSLESQTLSWEEQQHSLMLIEAESLICLQVFVFSASHGCAWHLHLGSHCPYVRRNDSGGPIPARNHPLGQDHLAA